MRRKMLTVAGLTTVFTVIIAAVPTCVRNVLRRKRTVDPAVRASIFANSMKKNFVPGWINLRMYATVVKMTENALWKDVITKLAMHRENMLRLSPSHAQDSASQRMNLHH
jgi:hypothetical protein